MAVGTVRVAPVSPVVRSAYAVLSFVLGALTVGSVVMYVSRKHLVLIRIRNPMLAVLSVLGFSTMTLMFSVPYALGDTVSVRCLNVLAISAACFVTLISTFTLRVFLVYWRSKLTLRKIKYAKSRLSPVVPAAVDKPEQSSKSRSRLFIGSFIGQSGDHTEKHLSLLMRNSTGIEGDSFKRLRRERLLRKLRRGNLYPFALWMFFAVSVIGSALAFVGIAQSQGINADTLWFGSEKCSFFFNKVVVYVALPIFGSLSS